jgi:hypothetical protein
LSNSEFPSSSLQKSQHFNLPPQRIELPAFSQPQPDTRCLKSTYEPIHTCRSYSAILTLPGLPQGWCQQGQAGRVIPTLPSIPCRSIAKTYHRAKKHCTDQGGKIEHEFKLVPGFTYVSLSLPQSHLFKNHLPNAIQRLFPRGQGPLSLHQRAHQRRERRQGHHPVKERMEEKQHHVTNYGRCRRRSTVDEQ